MRKSAAKRAPGAISGRNRNSGPMAQFVLPITEVLVVADCWQAEAGADSQTGVDSFGRRRDGAMDDGFGIGFGLPAIGDHENL